MILKFLSLSFFSLYAKIGNEIFEHRIDRNGRINLFSHTVIIFDVEGYHITICIKYKIQLCVRIC